MTGALILIPLFAALNRLAGDGATFRRLHLPGRPLWYATALALLVAGPWVGWGYAALCALSFATWRTLGWYNAIDGGTTDGQRARDFWVMTGRGFTLFPVFYASPFATALLAPTAFAIAIVYDVTANYLRKGKDPIPCAEVLAGAVLGLVFAFIHLFS